MAMSFSCDATKMNTVSTLNFREDIISRKKEWNLCEIIAFSVCFGKTWSVYQSFKFLWTNRFEFLESILKYSYHVFFQICKEEKKTGTLQVPLQKATARAASYTGLSATAVRRMGAMSLNRKPRKPRQDRYVIDTFDRDVIRRTVHEMLQKGGRVPTSRSISAEVREKILFLAKWTSLERFWKSTVSSGGGVKATDLF